MPASRPEARGDLGIYVHWPFCVRKCPYCDFNVHIRAQVDDRAWRDALATELAHFARLMPGRTLGSVYFGGGTPSLMAPDSVAALLDAAAGHFALAPDVEVTLESNPEDSGRLAGYRAAGVTRLSLGVQSLRDPDLAALGRGHSAAQAREAVAQAQRLFAATSFDLIYARPGQGPEAWRDEIGEALALAAGHLSLYQLTFEPGTAFHLALRRGALAAPGEDTAAALYELTQESCAAAGYSAYEVSSHAVPGQQSRHNLNYWRGGDYVGIGPGAHGRLTLEGQRIATRQSKHPETWLAAVGSAGHGTEAGEVLDRDTVAAEFVMMGLRLVEGVSLPAFEEAVGHPLAEHLAGERLERLVRVGLLALDAATLRATPRGRPVLDAVIGELLA